ncbi:efflux RND transporter permease subunit [Hymenobacter psoromatis]|uniref:efflux RND transporter permease subunit n=1 Tax=Hymenobacter psoromatis TaxID=1484116 RepID=UPI001CBB0C2D|nr:MMPL family transporter [Hymenobacter psoromatis]
MIDLLHRLRYPLLAALALAMALLWPGVRAAVAVDNSLSIWFLEGDPALRSYRAYQQRFGNDEVVVIVVRDSAQTLLTPANQRRLAELSAALGRLPAVHSVLGPAAARRPAGGLGGTTPLLAAGLDSAALRQALARQPTLRDQLFSPDFRTARLLVTLRQLPDFDQRRGAVLAAVRGVAGRYFAPGRAAWLGGVGVVYARLNELSQRDFGFFLGVGYLLMFAVLAALYRRAAWVLYALGIVATATYLTLGVYGALGYRLNLLTVLLPVVIILLGLMDTLHVLNEVQQLAALPPAAAEAALPPALRRRHLALHTLREMLFPCAATMLTNVAGFLALLSSPMPILRTFGLFAGLGIACCLVLTFLLGVWLLPLGRFELKIKNDKLKIGQEAAVTDAVGSLPAPRPRKPSIFNLSFLIFNSSSNSNLTARTGAALGRLYGWVLGHRKSLSLVSLGLVGFFAAGLPRLRADTYTLGYLPARDPVVLEHQAITRYWGPYLPLELLVHPGSGRALNGPEVVQASQHLADSLARLPGLGRVFGLPTLYRAGLEARLGPRRALAALGSTGALRLTHERLATDYPELLRLVEDSAGRTGRLTVAGPMLSARQLSRQMTAVQQLARRVLGPAATVEPAGYPPLYAAITQYVTSSQISSLLWSFAVVLGLVWALVRSLRLALLTVLPNLFPVLVVLGYMGWAGIALDTATASIAAIVLSLSVDDTVHFIHHYRRQRQQLGPAAARLATITHVGPAIVLTGAILFSGYAFMTLGSLKTVQLFGLLTAISIVGAMFGELIIFPLLLARFDREAEAV